MKLVIDASVSVKWFLPHLQSEQNVEQAIAISALLDSLETEVFAPPHWVAETVAVLARAELDLAVDALLVLEDIAAKIVSNHSTMRQAITLANRLNHHLFDTLYHAVALETGATLVTADDRYFAKARSQGHIVLLRDFQYPPESPATTT